MAVTTLSGLVEPDIRFHRVLVDALESRRLSRVHGAMMGETRLCMAQVQAHHLLDPNVIIAELSNTIEIAEVLTNYQRPVRQPPTIRVRIRGRKKEVMKTSGGKMVAPLPIEEAIKVSPLISQVCVVGDNRKYLSALVTLAWLNHRLPRGIIAAKSSFA